MRKLKHLPLDQWPTADIEAFASAYEPGDIFDETAGPGAHLCGGHAQDDPDQPTGVGSAFWQSTIRLIS